MVATSKIEIRKRESNTPHPINICTQRPMLLRTQCVKKKKKKKKGEKALSFFFLAWIFLFWGVHSSRCGSIGFWLSIFD